MESEHQVPIWFFIGGTLLVYGAIVLGAGIGGLWTPTEVQQKLQATNPDASWFFLHPGVWWGGLMMVVGGFYCVKFRPWRKP